MSSTTVTTIPATNTTPKKKRGEDSLSSTLINGLAKLVQTVAKRVHGNEEEFDLSGAAKKMLKPPTSSRKKKRGPKRASSAYMFFVQKRRSALKAENPTFSFTDMGKLMGATWKAMSEEARAPFVKLSEADKVRYASDVKKYNESGSSEVVDGREGGPKRTKVNA